MIVRQQLVKIGEEQRLQAKVIVRAKARRQDKRGSFKEQRISREQSVRSYSIF